jgi:hypothetical protein
MTAKPIAEASSRLVLLDALTRVLPLRSDMTIRTGDADRRRSG